MLESTSEAFYYAPNFITSAGIIILDVKSKLVVTISDEKGTRFTFPKGRVEPGESIEETAIREGYEETGYSAALLASTSDGFVKPIAVQLRSLPEGHPQRPFGRPATAKIVYWFAGQWDGQPQVAGTQLPYENYIVHRLPWETAKTKLSSHGDLEMLRRSVALVERS